MKTGFGNRLKNILTRDSNNMEITTKNGRKLSIDDSQESKDKVFQIIIDWIKEYDAFSWEMMGQDDDCQIYALECLGPVVDRIVKQTDCED